MSKLAHSNQETMDLIEAHRLAREIGVSQAREIRDAVNLRKGFGPPVSHYYDPLAVTCLGDLIHTRMRRKPR